MFFFVVAFYDFFVILGARGSILAPISGFLCEPWAFGKNSEKCATVINLRGLTPSRQSLFAGLDCGCVLMMGFYDFL